MISYSRLFYLLLSLGLLTASAALATKAPVKEYSGSAAYYDRERKIFNEARHSLLRGDIRKVNNLKNQISNFPLVYFLEFEQLKKKVSNSIRAQDQRAIEEFIAGNSDAALGRKLYRALLKSLAERGRWKQYVKVQDYERLGAQCDVLLAKVKNRQLKKFDKETKSLWIQPMRRKKACDRAFEKIERKDPPSTSMVWSRIYKLINKGRVSDTNDMLKYLRTSDKEPIKAWIKAYPNPDKYLPTVIRTLIEDTGLNRRILISVMQRWSKRDSREAYDYWKNLSRRYSFSRDARLSVDQLIARMAAFDGLYEAHEWLHQLPDSRISKSIRYWRIRTAMRNLDWNEVIYDIRSLTKKEQAENQWRYWLGRALEETGKAADAMPIFQALAKTQSYHGFLAADKLGQSYHLVNNAMRAGKEIKAKLALNKTLIRAREYEYAGLAWEGRRDWMSVVDSLDIPARFAAAELADDWGWADRSVFSVAKTGKKDALELRFPMPHTNEVQKASVKNAIETAWIYGVMRRESGFIEDIRSGAGAVGLMQLMPATAKDVARRQGKKRVGDLTSAKNNISLGSYYLRYVLNKFNNNQPLATAAYNAGPARVKRWLPRERALSADVWVDTIPYSETRRYVRAVMAYTTIFEWRMNQQVTPLNKRMPIINPTTVLSQI